MTARESPRLRRGTAQISPPPITRYHPASMTQVHHGLSGLKNLPKASALSIGNFDGVHLGHRRLLAMAHETRAPGGVTVVTFEPHPLTVLRPDEAPPRLSLLPLKQRLLEPLGVDHLVVLPPTSEVLDLTAEDFWRILRDDVQPAHMIEGESFTFGKGRGGSIDRLLEWTSQSNIQLHIAEPVRIALLNLHIVPASSSLVRWLLIQGRVRDASICLGHPYVLQGKVVKGFQRGRTIGMPTANLDGHGQLMPAEGVYAGRCSIDGKTYSAAISIGTMPTFGEHNQQVEVHLIDFTGDLYDRTIEVEVIDWIRAQWKFENVDLLKIRMADDLLKVKQRVGLILSEPIATIS